MPRPCFLIPVLLQAALLFLAPAALEAQHKCWVYLADKPRENGLPAVSPQTLSNRRLLGLALHQYTDLPLSPVYLRGVADRGIRVVNTSRWLNAFTAFVTEAEAAQLRALPFVTAVQRVATRVAVAGRPANDPVTDAALHQINYGALKTAGLTGKGITIGIIDVGFDKADNHQNLQHLFRGKRVVRTRDFVHAGRADFYQAETPHDDHGTHVWQLLAGFDPRENRQLGLATGASFYLARSDRGDQEFRGEEDYWIAALEWMDSTGVRLVHSSIGYSLDYDDPKENHRPEDMDGKTLPITRAAQLAATQKGMTIVVSAGNDGENAQWGVVSAPADAEGVLAVGATLRGGAKAGYSAVGPAALPYVKPNVACYSPGGTSLAAPVITGLLACIMQHKPGLSNQQMIAVIEQSGHLYPYGNNHLGYGIPDAEKILQLLQDPDFRGGQAEKREARGGRFTFAGGLLPAGQVVIFHKRDKFTVTKQETVDVSAAGLVLAQPAGVTRSSVVAGKKTYEIFWQ